MVTGTRQAPWHAVLAVLVGVSLVSAACGGTDDDSSAGEAGASAEDSDAAAHERLDALLEGTHRQPPVDGPRAQPDRNVWVISCGEAIESCAVSSAAAVEAAETIGWDVTLFDGELNASVASTGIRAATADDADGIVLYGLDCQDLQGALQEARQADVEVVAFDGFDCDDPSVGGEPLFSTEIGEVSDDYEGHAASIRAWGDHKAAWLIAETDGLAKVIEIRQIGALVTDYIHDGFLEGMARCPTCEIVATVEVTLEDVATGRVGEKVSSALLEHPEANAVHVPYDALVALGVGTAIEESGRSDELAVMGGEGFPSNLDVIAAGGPQDAAVASVQEWIAWAAVDTLNRVFAGETEIPDAGFGYQLVDRNHNLSPDGEYQLRVDFKSAYREVWGV